MALRKNQLKMRRFDAMLALSSGRFRQPLLSTIHSSVLHHPIVGYQKRAFGQGQIGSRISGRKVSMANMDAQDCLDHSGSPNHSATPPTTKFMNPPEDKLPVLIIGSAVAGTVFALQLLTHPTLRARYRPIIFDSAPTLPGLESFEGALGSETTGQSGAAVALTKQAMWPLRQLQLGPELDEISQNTEELTMYRQPVFGLQNGSQAGVKITTMSAPSDVGILGGMWTIERGPLQALLIKKVLERGGEVIPNKKLVKIVEHANDTSPVKDTSQGAIEAIFEDRTSYHGSLLIGADGAWSTVRKHLYTTPSPSSGGTETVNEAWKPDFQNLQIVHGVSHAPTTDTKPVIYSMGLRDAGCGTWTLKGSTRQYWTIYTAPVDPPPSDAESRASSAEGDESLGRELGMQIYSGGYGRASTEALLERYKDVWHPSAGTFGNLFENSEKIIRVGLWQKLFTRLSNVSWNEEEERPKECAGDMGVDGGKGNIVLIGDAARVLMPTSGQGRRHSFFPPLDVSILLFHIIIIQSSLSSLEVKH